MDILNSAPGKKLPQNCRNDIRENTPDGLDRGIKQYLNSDLRTANIITDLLESVGIVSNIQIMSETGRLIKGSQLNPLWCWEPQTTKNFPIHGPTISEIKDQIRIYRTSLQKNPDDAGTWRAYEAVLLKLQSLDADEYRTIKKEELINNRMSPNYDTEPWKPRTGRKHVSISMDEVSSYLERNKDFDEYD